MSTITSPIWQKDTSPGDVESDDAATATTTTIKDNDTDVLSQRQQSDTGTSGTTTANMSLPRSSRPKTRLLPEGSPPQSSSTPTRMWASYYDKSYFDESDIYRGPTLIAAKPKEETAEAETANVLESPSVETLQERLKIAELKLQALASHQHSSLKKARVFRSVTTKQQTVRTERSHQLQDLTGFIYSSPWIENRPERHDFITELGGGPGIIYKMSNVDVLCARLLCSPLFKFSDGNKRGDWWRRDDEERGQECPYTEKMFDTDAIMMDQFCRFCSEMIAECGPFQIPLHFQHHGLTIIEALTSADLQTAVQADKDAATTDCFHTHPRHRAQKALWGPALDLVSYSGIPEEATQDAIWTDNAPTLADLQSAVHTNKDRLWLHWSQDGNCRTINLWAKSLSINKAAKLAAKQAGQHQTKIPKAAMAAIQAARKVALCTNSCFAELCCSLHKFLYKLLLLI